nr:hypothetical protein [Tanacetum cinerariifolium]
MIEGNIPFATSAADVAAMWDSGTRSADVTLPCLAGPKYCSCQSEVRCQVAGVTRFRLQVRGVMIGSGKPIISSMIQGSGSTRVGMRFVDLGIF